MSNNSDSLWERNNHQLPKMFSMTYYRLPTQVELVDIDKYNLKAKDIYEGFCYTLIGRGVPSASIGREISQSINMLINKYPNNPEYSKALQLFKTDFRVFVFKPSEADKLNADSTPTNAINDKKAKWIGVVLVLSIFGILWLMVKND